MDPTPNLEGSPGLFGESLVTPIKSEIYYDNVVVSPRGRWSRMKLRRSEASGRLQHR